MQKDFGVGALIKEIHCTEYSFSISSNGERLKQMNASAFCNSYSIYILNFRLCIQHYEFKHSERTYTLKSSRALKMLYITNEVNDLQMKRNCTCFFISWRPYNYDSMKMVVVYKMNDMGNNSKWMQCKANAAWLCMSSEHFHQSQQCT